MPLDRTRVSRYLQRCQFADLFIEELGWDEAATPPFSVTVDNHTYALRPVAQKRGVMALEARLPHIPPVTMRRKIESQVVKRYRQHFIIFVEGQGTRQIWQWVLREPGFTGSRSHEYLPTQSGESLIQKLSHIAFSLDQEDGLTHTDVVGSIKAAFNIERATRAFFAEFKKQRDLFQKFLAGIPDDDLQSWYASVMLNRIMFIYFIQKKRFLDNDPDYLRTHLTQSKAQGQDRYYRHFLCPLFFEGFAKDKHQRTPENRRLLGDIPYLNGGIFQRHQVETLHGQTIDIPDRAFDRLYDFFDSYQWHLDDRPLRDDNEINPDVLGYIFEQYINQKQMGAYYTKEDITDYISKNTILPFLFDQVQQSHPAAFQGENSIWRLLSENPHSYIYSAVQQGVDSPLPPEIAAGVDDVSRRAVWNTPTPDPYALPTEIWRETVARRRHYADLHAKLAAGEVTAINDLITLNLDIAQFARDVLENSQDPALIRSFWHALNRISVLDPTCGSGAFLFAALNILRPLYEACLDRMELFIAAAPQDPALDDFRAVLDGIAHHPNRDYFVLKSIVVNNLYGVDIMEEATEIAKLRLFLKLVAQVQDVARLEPLPDIDFNIRAGNTLVGFTSKDEMEQVVRGDRLLLLPEDEELLAEIHHKAAEADDLFSRFRHLQTSYTTGSTATEGDDVKEKLRRHLAEINDRLNRLLAQQYNVDPDKAPYAPWLKSHQPFHWFVEFFGILRDGGFDVIVGNPPYIELRQVKDYKCLGYETESCGNLYALVMERGGRLNVKSGRQGYIVPVSSISTDRYGSLQKLLKSRWLCTSAYDDRPSRLFDGLQHIRLTIHIIGGASSDAKQFSTRYNKWYRDERPDLFETLQFASSQIDIFDNTIPKLTSPLEHSILAKMLVERHLATFYSRTGQHRVNYSRKVGYFLQVLDFEPLVLNSRGEKRPPSEFKSLQFESKAYADVVLCCLNSSLFYWFITVTSDCRHLNKREIDNFPIDLATIAQSADSSGISILAVKLMADLKLHSEMRTMSFRHDTLQVQSILPKYSKQLMDQIDIAIAQHYGFTDEELDFILNYDIKYRMGDELVTEDEGDEDE